jgi:hypothetical protein
MALVDSPAIWLEVRLAGLSARKLLALRPLIWLVDSAWTCALDRAANVVAVMALSRPADTAAICEAARLSACGAVIELICVVVSTATCAAAKAPNWPPDRFWICLAVALGSAVVEIAWICAAENWSSPVPKPAICAPVMLAIWAVVSAAALGGLSIVLDGKGYWADAFAACSINRATSFGLER